MWADPLVLRTVLSATSNRPAQMRGLQTKFIERWGRILTVGYPAYVVILSGFALVPWHCYGFEQQQRSSAQVASRSRNCTAVCE